MLSFSDFVYLGLTHILDPNGIDHILFILSLCAPYSIRDWKLWTGLITAFTLGHSLTLALSTLKIVFISSNIVEAIIPVTIIISSLLNLIDRKSVV